ncbi:MULTISPECIES: potassium-transporting ATPase subunit KdpB [Saccharothrix]|uniref:potassium-transporting ATPase subunit KdpB n=1 Tax=Saccharothrix TaxID=2071 RepID=UPI000968B143|nr:potassium-transporting ATPase subunit KdpB [Saccharothrix sp. CB00851]OKI26923.1 potassium transporter KtrB [Saccharothrix sp. CB00851]
MIADSPQRTRVLIASLPDALRKLHPRDQVRNPVMFVAWVGSLLVTVFAIADPDVFTVAVAAWLWATVLFANLAEAVAEGRGKAQADSLRRTRNDAVARRLTAAGGEERVPGAQLRVGDLVVVEAGEVVPGDGDVVEGIATVDESVITGESAPVVREAGGDRSAVTGGTTVLSDRIVVRVTTRPGETFVDRMIALVEGARRQKTPNEVALTILLSTLTIIFLLAVVALQPFAIYSGGEQSVIVLTALLVCLIPTTIGALLSAIGIAGVDRLVRRNVLATSGKAVEAAGDVDTLLLDKTGTITWGNRRATELIPVEGVDERTLAEAALLSSLADGTPEGRSVVELCVERYGLSAEATAHEKTGEFVPFSAQTRMSGVDLGDRRVRKGAASAFELGDVTRRIVAGIGQDGGTPLVVAENDVVLEIGKQLLITRGALTTFSVANDLAKYFAILPAMFAAIHPQLGRLNVMQLTTPQSAILSAVIFNALVIVALIPLALRGVRYRPSGASALLRRNLLVYGLGGVVTPFAGIWLIDLLVRLVPGIG